jgi:hypothetical protein
MNQVTTQTSGPLATIYHDLMDDAPIDTSDLVIPKILLMQGMSKLVQEEKARLGEMRDSLDNSLLGSKDTPLEFIPFQVFKSWLIFHVDGNKIEYQGQEPMTAANASWPLEEIVDGKVIRRDKALNFFCVLPSEVEEGLFFPKILSFRRTSYQAGKKLETWRAKLKAFNKPLAAKTFKLISNKTENDLGVFYTFDIEAGRDTTEAELKAASQWRSVVAAKPVKIDDSDLRSEADKVHVEEAEESAF